MIKSITVYNHINESLNMVLASPEKSGFAITNIEGLTPGKANINITELASGDGAIYNSARKESRNIVLSLRFVAMDIEAQRRLSYRYFPIKKQIRLVVETDSQTVEIYGYVESNDAVIFTQQSGTQISIICPKPYFSSITKYIATFSNITSLFEFEFYNNTSDNTISFGSIVKDQLLPIIYDGDVDTGMDIVFKIFGPVVSLTLNNMITNGTFPIDHGRLVTMTGSGLVGGDEVYISTNKENRYIKLLRGGNYISILNCVPVNAEWFQLTNGYNLLAYTAVTGVDNFQIEISYTNKYEGV